MNVHNVQVENNFRVSGLLQACACLYVSCCSIDCILTIDWSDVAVCVKALGKHLTVRGSVSSIK